MLVLIKLREYLYWIKKNKYDSLKYFIDIHRDSVGRSSTTTNIGGKDYAKVLFVVGLEHNNYKDNLKTAEDINYLVNKYYPKLSKGMSYVKKSKNQVIVSVDTEKTHTQKALEELVKCFDIDDFNIDNESLEDIIRGIYEED